MAIAPTLTQKTYWTQAAFRRRRNRLMVDRTNLLSTVVWLTLAGVLMWISTLVFQPHVIDIFDGVCLTPVNSTIA